MTVNDRRIVLCQVVGVNRACSFTSFWSPVVDQEKMKYGGLFSILGLVLRISVCALILLVDRRDIEPVETSSSYLRQLGFEQLGPQCGVMRKLVKQKV